MRANVIPHFFVVAGIFSHKLTTACAFLSYLTQITRWHHVHSQNGIKFRCIASNRGLGPGGTHLKKVVQVCPAVKTPFSRFSRHSLYPQSQYDSVLYTPTLSKNNKYWLVREKLVKNLNFQLYSLNLAQISVYKPSKYWKIFSSLALAFNKKSVL